jgi:hypothetical protein
LANYDGEWALSDPITYENYSTILAQLRTQYDAIKKQRDEKDHELSILISKITAIQIKQRKALRRENNDTQKR